MERTKQVPASLSLIFVTFSSLGWIKSISAGINRSTRQGCPPVSNMSLYNYYTNLSHPSETEETRVLPEERMVAIFAVTAQHSVARILEGNKEEGDIVILSVD